MNINDAGIILFLKIVIIITCQNQLSANNDLLICLSHYNNKGFNIQSKLL